MFSSSTSLVTHGISSSTMNESTTTSESWIIDSGASEHMLAYSRRKHIEINSDLISPSPYSFGSSSGLDDTKLPQLDMPIALHKETAVPANIDEALKHKHWHTTLYEEIKALENNDTWDIINRPIGKNLIGYCLDCKVFQVTLIHELDLNRHRHGSLLFKEKKSACSQINIGIGETGVMAGYCSQSVEEILQKKHVVTGNSNIQLYLNPVFHECRLGATPVMELMIAAGKAVPQLQLEHGLAIDRVYTGSFMTSLDMAGFSISIMKADPAILARLDAPTRAPCWPVGVEGNSPLLCDRPPTKIPVPVPASNASSKKESIVSEPRKLNELGCILQVAIEAAAQEIINLTEKLNEWDSKVGDGDCGSTMYRGATTILEDIKCYPLNDAAETVNEIGASLRRVMGGTSGILYDIFCKAAYASLKQNQVISSRQWATALEASVAAVSKYGGAVAGYRTMLDALIPASEVLRERLDAGDDPLKALLLSSEAAVTGAESTKNMRALAGRSSYIAPDLLSSVPDPGAMAAATWYRAVAQAHELRKLLYLSLCHSAVLQEP
ncbi:hypothetical protein ZIOFF_016154 [Zingiber officinale]|uniref:Uncharacterized protein n=1 Tax=Zingiber officinale TaxID=94328 RepID=A0A8J5I2B6_ZINOF|nr:hypothetical protein ZIOFF_016154 [Zingiber officinale]